MTNMIGSLIMKEGKSESKVSMQSLINALEESLNGFTLGELKVYSLLLIVISAIGFLCHLVVFFILIYQQTRRAMAKRKSLRGGGGGEKDYAAPFLLYPSQHAAAHAGATSLSSSSLAVTPTSPPKSKAPFVEEFQMNSYFKQPAAMFRPNQNLLNQKQQQYNNYVTYAFVFHQTLVDLIRLVYCLFYANNVYFEYKKYILIRDNLDLITYTNLVEQEQTILKNFSAHDLSYQLSYIYENYCIQMASFYSVLTMVTIVNILTILISETCRFYDLKLNSSDTSNYCCVLFGILLIWTSSLIIISSLMLVGVADSAAPTWKCNLAETESTTRSLVINVVWFFLVMFVVLISFSYSCSLYKELRRIDHEDNRFALYTINASLMAFKSELLERQIKIVQQTKKRLVILVMLIIIYCVTFVPNFTTTILKNTLFATRPMAIRPYNLIFSILALSNPMFNSIILLLLCVRSDDHYLNELSLSESLADDGADVSLKGTKMNRLRSMFNKRFGRKEEEEA
jgi:hypothetical protein